VQLPDFLQGQKKDFVTSNANILRSARWKFLKKKSLSSQSSVLQDPMVICLQKWYLKKIGTSIRNDSF